VASVLLLLTLTAALRAQIPEGMEEDGAFRPHPEAEKAISQLYSPFCHGFMLEVCPVAGPLRDSIEALAYQGWTSDQLVDWVLTNYGEQYRAIPETKGWGIWAWVLPPAALLAGIAMVVLALRRFKPRTGAGASEAGGKPSSGEGAISEEEEQRLRAAIRDMELSEDPSF
jgi:cytochrome c-type biogenesis protein CcmH/NrfF